MSLVKQQIRKILSDTNNSSTINARIKKIKCNFFKEIPQLSSNSYENMYLWLNNLLTIPKCKECNSENLKYLGINRGYNLYCSKKCYYQNEESREKRKKTCRQKYGGNSSLCDPIIFKKAKKTMVERYGVEHALQNTALQDKANATIIERFGPMGLKAEAIKVKRKNTNMKLYGVEYSSQHLLVKGKVKATHFKNYGMWKTQTPAGRLNLSNIKKQTLYNNLKNRCPGLTPMFSIADYIGVNATHKWSCNICYTNFYDHMDDGKIPLCPYCNTIPTTNQSKGEIEVGEYIQNILNINIEQNNKSIISPYELDIIISEKKIAIEYNGLYWHSNRKVLPNYHKMKLDMCNNAGYQLITIFENEWLNRKESCKNRLKHILGVDYTTCYARQPTIKEITNNEHKNFVNKYHIQGFIGAKVKLGAFYKDKLVAVMTFGKKQKARFNKKSTLNTYELLRFCVKDNIPGVGSKLFKYFTRNYKPNKIISYCDLRWGTGDFYEKLGFKLSYISEPNYWYSINGTIKYHRYNFKESILTNGELTKKEIIESRRCYRIYDCGNNVYIWNNN